MRQPQSETAGAKQHDASKRDADAESHYFYRLRYFVGYERSRAQGADLKQCLH